MKGESWWKVKIKKSRIHNCEAKLPGCLGKFVKSRKGQGKICVKCLVSTTLPIQSESSPIREPDTETGGIFPNFYQAIIAVESGTAGSGESSG